VDLESEANLDRGTITLDKEYTPEDIAEYIFLTGDERGVAMSLNDLLNDGIMVSEAVSIHCHTFSIHSPHSLIVTFS
jgi:hypothetical protein